MNLKNAIRSVLVALSLVFASVAQAALTYSSNFAAAGTGGCCGGYYFFIGHEATENYIGTGLTSVNELEVSLIGGQSGNYATEPLGLTFSLNGTDVGSYTYAVGSSAGVALDFIFADLFSASGDWTLQMRVTTPVCAGCGAVQLSTASTMTLTGAAVPEPATLALLGVGLAGLAATRRRKQ